MKPIKKVKRVILIASIVYVGMALLTPHFSPLRNRSIENQITYLSELLNSGYDDELQQQYPEGKMFSNALLSLSIIEYCDKRGITDKAMAEQVDSCILRILSTSATSPFPTYITPKFGMFYNGWTNRVLTSYQRSSLFSKSDIPERVNTSQEEIEERITSALDEELQPLMSYAGAYWPADNYIGIMSISDTALQSKWMAILDSAASHPTGLVHHFGGDSSIVRGSSSALILYSLSYINQERALRQNNIFDSLFQRSFLGANLVKEHEDGSGIEDVDSGPLLFGYGASATIMNIKTQASLGMPGARATWGWLNLMGMPINLWSHKYYLFKKEPMLDIFMLWSCVSL
ncbi:hypothetical protein [Phaeocystidibacter marisrubri]|uniref:DUF3131 domain-containing protein n=1 Tax=Phaeocystidibacter marisrubri TaxID=1577780 RepID=A0A6L3ZGG7_9FLAO|nr:hypothetical protein [Phaeocystidibacter marisrubri]KAB2816444.1 hypothetical protein F8C82_12240 [Phaeocystidibacter marisrubri]GGH69089.1 hypothetical protein GCM10011318_09760 [Phaeocystidibacter marisrubri]